MTGARKLDQLFELGRRSFGSLDVAETIERLGELSGVDFGPGLAPLIVDPALARGSLDCGQFEFQLVA